MSNPKLTDPYVRMVIGNSSATSRTLDETLTPVWDETFVIERIMLPGNPAALKDALPSIVVECYDHDEIVRFSHLHILYYLIQILFYYIRVHILTRKVSWPFQSKVNNLLVS